MIRTTRRTILALLAALLTVGLSPALAWAAPPDPSSPAFGAYVMSKLDDQYRGEKSHAKMAMEIKTEHWTRKLTMEAWSLGQDYSLVRILKPRKEKGTATLKAKKDLFTYLNKTGRTIKISSGMMGGSWMGSHFTNDDLIRHSRLARDYHIKTTFNGTKGGVGVYDFTLTPKPDAPVVWGKLVITIRAADLEPLRQVFYDEDGAPVRELVFSDHKKIDDRVVPLKMVMRPLDSSGHPGTEYTRITYQSLDFGVKLKKSFFSLQKLKSL
ncbi:MAG: outer membrane lipoprotein-sorting protein [Deltaproteobacteria bacterium]|nr:MAG: outer membrane lipoprotein-sorting protein [Deltaproteobacteria bacterium]